MWHRSLAGHTTYDASHDSLSNLRRSLRLLWTHYAALPAADVLLWHEGDFSESDIRELLPWANATSSSSAVNVRSCLLDCCSGWGAPPTVRSLHMQGGRVHIPEYTPNFRLWAPGYLYMIRLYAVTLWGTLRRLGYSHVMRMDDDSFIHSPVAQNLFQTLRVCTQRARRDTQVRSP